MSDILSQDEIDRLLTAAPTEPPSGTTELSPAEVAAVEKVARVLFAAANSALATLLARPAAVTEGLGQVADVADVDSGKGFLLRVPFRSGFSGELAFLIPHQEAAVLADLILGGEGEAKDPLEEGDLDALKEAFAQVTGSGAPTVTAMLDREVAFEPPDGREVESGDLAGLLPWGQAYLGVGTIQVEGVLESPLRLLLPVPVAREIAQLVGGGPEEAAAPAAPYTPAPLTPAVETGGRQAPAPEIRNINLILDIEVEVMVRLGQAELPLRGIQRLRPGSIIDLDKDTDAPVELVVNDRVIARGELVVVGSDHFALRITEIETPTERIRTLGP